MGGIHRRKTPSTGTHRKTNNYAPTDGNSAKENLPSHHRAEDSIHRQLKTPRQESALSQTLEKHPQIAKWPSEPYDQKEITRTLANIANVEESGEDGIQGALPNHIKEALSLLIQELMNNIAT